MQYVSQRYKLHLKLKKITHKIVIHIMNYYDSDPNGPYLSMLLGKRHDLLEIAKENFPDVYKRYIEAIF